MQLTWNSEEQDVLPQIVVQGDPPDSHDERVARVRHTMRQERRERQFQVAEQFILSVVDRVGPIPTEGGIPRMLRRQQWSVLNVPLMWSGAEGNRQCWTPERLASRAELLPSVTVGGVEVPGREAAITGWEVFHNAMRSWGIESREGLSEWINHQGFPRPRWGAHFSSRVQERILSLVIARDSRGTVFESLYVHMVMHGLPRISEEAQPGHRNTAEDREFQSSPQNGTPSEVFDDIDLEEEFQHRFQVLQGFPAHLKWRFRQAARVALEARHNAVHNNDHTMEVRAWKLFLLLPFMLLRKARGVGKVGKDELSRRFDKFSEGQRRILLEEARRAVQVVPESPPA